MRRRELLAAGSICGASSVLCVVGAVWGGEPAYRVIVHPANALRTVPSDWLADAFLKKTTRWPEGEIVRPVDQRAASEVRKAFSHGVLRRSVGAVRSYWQQRIFSGRDVPPPEVDSDEAVVTFVSKYPGAVGYVGFAVKLAGVRELVIK
ncbi:MAG: hypothetical protein K0R38_5174 [Polyangiaceae bacterium]|jgi:ABC-type phosphate transport system substrate-binding protein|nr:hypothetical protein [Polyangiaceae bacterium]